MSKAPAPKPPEFHPQTANQAVLCDLLDTKTQVIASGPAGTGKTFLSTMFALEGYLLGHFDRMIFARPNVAAGPTIGLLPGGSGEKLDPWFIPIKELLDEVLGRDRVIQLTNDKVIEFAAFENMRGRTFDYAFVLLDEAQNTTPLQIKMFLGRMGQGTKVVLAGDVDQCDLRGRSGLDYFIQSLAFEPDEEIGHVEFTLDDIVRSDITGRNIRRFHRFDAEERDARDARETLHGSSTKAPVMPVSDRAGLDSFLVRAVQQKERS